MDRHARRAVLGLLLLAASGAPPFALAQYYEEPGLDDVSLSGTTPESIILQWPTFSYRLARYMISKYGQPAQSSDVRLVWLDNGPWKKTVVYRVPPGGRTLGDTAGRLEQSVEYRVPAEKRGELARFDREIGFDEKAGLLTVLSNDEGDNFLAVNLADEVVRGRRTAKEASDFRRQILRLQDSGKSSPYLERLLFVAERPSGREIPPIPN